MQPHLYSLLRILGDLGVVRKRLLHDTADVRDWQEAVLLPQLVHFSRVFSHTFVQVSSTVGNFVCDSQVSKARDLI